MSVDLTAPFSPMRACTSPARRVKSTLSSARTPGKRMVMPRISTAGTISVSAGIWSARPLMVTLRRGRSRPRRSRCAQCGVGSVRAGVDGRRRLLLRERAVLREVLLLDSVVGEDALDQACRLVTEERVALDDVVDLPVDQRLHTVVDSVDRDDLDVGPRLAAGRLDGLDRAEGHVVVVGEHEVDPVDAVLLQEAIHDLLAAVAGEVAGLGVDRLDLAARDALVEPGGAVVGR